MYMSPEQEEFLTRLNHVEFQCLLYDLILNERFHCEAHRLIATWQRAKNYGITPELMAMFAK